MSYGVIKVTKKKSNLNPKENINNNEEIKKENKKSNNFFTIFIFLVTVALLTFLAIKLYNNYNLAANKIVRQQLVNILDEDYTPKSGLFIDTLETGYDVTDELSSKYYFKGKNVNNYIVFEGGCWRIIHITQNNLLKIIYMGKAINNTCENIDFKDGNVNNDNIAWGNNSDFLTSDIKTQLKEWEKSNHINNVLDIDFTSGDSKVERVKWSIGKIDFKSTSNSLNADVLDERENNSYEGKIGLISVTDYLKAGCNLGSFYSNSSCKDNNYLYTGIDYWTIIGEGTTDDKAWAVVEEGSVNAAPITKELGIYPVIYLKSNVKITGSGSSKDPYIVQ